MAAAFLTLSATACDEVEGPVIQCEPECFSSDPDICGLEEYILGLGTLSCQDSNVKQILVQVNESSFMASGTALANCGVPGTVIGVADAGATTFNNASANVNLSVSTVATSAERDIPAESATDQTSGCGTTNSINSLSYADSPAMTRFGLGVFAITFSNKCNEDAPCLNTELDIEVYPTTVDEFGMTAPVAWTFEEQVLECDSATGVCDVNIGVVTQHELGHVAGLGDQVSDIYESWSLMSRYDRTNFGSIVSPLPPSECRALWYIYGPLSGSGATYPPAGCPDPVYDPSACVKY
jgi:hypothetical protein